MTSYQVSANGTIFGIYSASTEQAARDLCAQDAGYKSEADMVSRLERQSELVAVEVDRGQVAEDWYNGSTKAELLQWATKHGLDIGQDRDQLDSDWNERVIDAYAAAL